MRTVSLTSHLQATLEGLRSERTSWWGHWGELAQYIIPRRFRQLVSPNNWNRGQAMNQFILDSTGTIAARTLQAGMMSGITSPSRPWFHLSIEGFDVEDSNPVTLWLSEVERRMRRVFQESNFYNACAVMWGDLAVFGTAPVVINEDYNDVIRCVNLTCGEYYVALSDRNAVDTIYREFTMTAKAIVQWFGYENCSTAVRNAVDTGGNALLQEFIVCHAIEPNIGQFEGMKVPKIFPFREIYWEDLGSGTYTGVLRQTGLHEFNAICPRWDVTSNDAYGRSPAMEALPDIKQLQQETKRKAQAIDKMVSPPIVADVQLKNQPTSLLPGGVTYVAGINNVGVKPIYTVIPPIQELKDDIQEIQARIKTIFYNDLFLMISQLDTVRTATEIDSRRAEQLIMLGPVLERSNNEALAPAIDRVFAIMNRAGLLPPPPPEIQGRTIKTDFVSMLADAQNAVATASIERTLALAGNLVAVQPNIMDNIDTDEAIQDYGRRLRVDPKLIRSDEDIAKLRAAKAKAEAEAQAAQAAPDLAKAGKTLSETNVGGGMSALQMAMGGSGGGTVQ